MLACLPEGDAKWLTLKSGYRVAYNPRNLLQDLAANPTEGRLWKEVWDELHHQGDVDTASYVAAICLIHIRNTGVIFGWDFYAFVALIEIKRHQNDNPAIPEWLSEEYANAWSRITPFCVADMGQAADSDQMRVYLSTLAVAAGHLALGDLILTIDNDQIEGFLTGTMGW